MATVDDVRSWLSTQLAAKIGVTIAAEPGYESVRLAPDEALLAGPATSPNAGRTWQTARLADLAALYQPRLPAGIVLSGALVQADFDAFRTALSGTGHQAIVDAWRAQRLI